MLCVTNAVQLCYYILVVGANCTVPTFTHYNLTGARTIYYEGETFNVTCIDGFKLIGQSNLTCSNQGNWTPHVPHCTKICKIIISLYICCIANVTV